MLLQLIVFAAVINLGYAGKYGIAKPCRLNDYRCIRDNFAANSKCNPRVKGFLPPKYTIPRFQFETPFFNATYIDTNLTIRNHDKCVVSEFFFNVGSDTALLALECRNLDLESNRTLIQHRSLKEDTVYNFYIRAVYPLIRLTINARHANVLDMCSAFVFADVAVLPTFHIDPKDKCTADYLSRDLKALNIYERETFYYRAPELARFFINSVLCDFGCNY